MSNRPKLRGKSKKRKYIRCSRCHCEDFSTKTFQNGMIEAVCRKCQHVMTFMKKP